MWCLKKIPSIWIGLVLLLWAMVLSPDVQAAQTDWEYESYGDGIVVTAYNGTAEDVYVPSELDDQPVIKLGDDLFRNNDALNSVTLGNGITEIGARAFYDCDNLVCIVTNEQLTTIGAEAFYSCDAMNSIIIYDSVVTIGEQSFANCQELTVWCNENTAAHAFVLQNNISFEILNPNATPQTYMHDGVTYYIMNGEAIAVDFDQSTTEVTIPATVEGFPVTQLRETFRECRNLTAVTLPDGLKCIDDYTFYYCNKLTNIVLPDSLVSIGFQAFGYCSNLTAIRVPDGVTDISASTFSQCRKLTSVTLPDTVTKIGNYAFNFCSALQEITIPDGVTGIGSSAFAHCYALTSVTIPDGVTAIEGSTFFECRSLTSVTFGSNVKSIGHQAFYGCKSLKGLEFPKQLKTIASSAFSSCSALQSVILPDGVTTIGNYAFSDSKDLVMVILPESVKSLQTSSFATGTVFLVYANSYAYTFAQENGLLFFVYDGGTQPQVVRQEGITYYIMGGEAVAIDFDGVATQVVIPDSVSGYPVTQIGEIFRDCNRLASVTLPKGLKELDDFAFSGCGALTCVTIPQGITAIGKAAFSHCYKLTEITIPDGVTVIGENAFYDCDCLTSITITDSVTSLGAAFRNCSNLTNVTLGNGVTTIVAETFLNCVKLSSVQIGNQVTGIAGNAFKNCSAIKKVVIPQSVTSLSVSAFPTNTILMVYANSYAHIYAQTNDLLYHVYNGIDQPLLVQQGGVTYYITGGEALAIDFDESTTYVEIPSVVVGYPVRELRETFRNCAYVTEVVLPQGLRRIGNYCFAYCGSMKAVTIPDSVTQIGVEAFAYCTDLTSVTIPDSVNQLGNRAFYCCTAMTTATIGNGLSVIEYQTFRDCDALTSVWIPDGLTQIGDNAFSGCYKLESVTIPDSVTKIGSSAFAFCKSLQVVTIPDSVTVMGNDVFYGCAALSSVKISENLNTLGSFLFNACSALKHITIPQGVTSIGSSAFAACTELRHVLIPESVNAFRKDSFAGNTILMVYENSYAHNFAAENDMLYFVVRKTENPEVAYGAGIFGVVSYMDGTAVSGATVDIFYGDGALKETVIADAFGAYEFTYAEVGEYLIRATDANGNSSVTAVSVKRMNAFDVFVSGDTNLTLKRGWTVSGTVSDAATVTITDAKGNVLDSVQSADGSFAFSNVPNGTYVLKAEADMGSVTKEITVYNGDLNGITMELPKQIATIWGFTQVENRDGSRALRNWVNVTLYNAEGVVVAQVKTDAGGKFRFENLPFGSYRILAQTAEFRPDHHGRLFHRSYTLTGFAFVNASAAGEHQADILLREVHEQETGVSGKVTAHGQTQDSEVILRDVGGNEYARYITGKNGKYSFVNIPDGVYIISAITPKNGMGYTVITIRDCEIYGDTDITVHKHGKLTQLEMDFYADLGNCSTQEDAKSLRSRIAREKRLYDGLSEKEKKQLSKEYVQTLNQLVEWAVNCAYMTEDGVVLTNGGTVISGDELENGESVSFNLSVEKVQYSEISADGVKNATDYVYYDMLDAAGESRIQQYYEISMTKTVGDTEKVITSVTKDTDTTGTFRITMKIPEEYRGQKHYNMLHVHNGETVVLADLDEDPNTITFEVTGFSTFALAASDEILIPITNAQIWHSTELFGNYISLEDALSGYDSSTQYVKLTSDATVNLALTQDLYIDLNGCDLSGTILTNGYKVYGMDSTTNKYTCDTMGTFSCVDENGNAIIPESLYTTENMMRYLTIETENGYTFHRFYLGITNISLVPSVTGFGYKAEFYGDEMVQQQIASIGYHLWLDAGRVISKTANFKNTLTLRLKNFDVANYGNVPVNACVTITLTDGTVITGETHSNTMKQVVETVNSNYADYTESQLAAVSAMIEANPIMQNWAVENIYKKEF